jgi:hypothetical protein
LEPLTIAEFIMPRLGGVRRLMDVGAHLADLGEALDLPAGIQVEVLDPSELEPASLGEGDLLVWAVDQGAGSAELASALPALRALGPGSSFILILNGAAAAGLDERVVEALVATQSRVVELARVLDEGAWAIAAGRNDPAGSTASSEAGPQEGSDEGGDTGLAEGIRLATRFVVASASGSPDGSSAAPAAVDPIAQAEIRRLRRQVRESTERAAALEGSVSYRLERLAVKAARQPRRMIHRLPDVIRSGGRRALPGAPGRAATGRSPAQAIGAWHESIRYAPERLHLAYSNGSLGARTGLVIAGLIRDETESRLSPDVVVHRLLPNDALLTLERVDPDLVLVETGAFGAGQAWAFTASASAVDRDRTLLELLALAHRLGRPAVLWKSPAVPEPVGITLFEPLFDLVLNASSWDPGVQLATFNPSDLDPERSGPPLFVGAWDPRAGRGDAERLLGVLQGGAGEGLEILVDERSLAGAEAFPASLRHAIRGTLDPSAAAGRYRSRRVVIGDPNGPGGLGRALEALACGARIVSPPNDRLAAAAGSQATFISPGEDVAAAIRSANDLPPLAEPAIRPAARRIFETHAVPVAVAAISGLLGLPADPLRSRGISILLDVLTVESATAIVDALRAQAYRPREVVLPAGTDGDDAGMARLAGLADLGIAIRTIDGAGSGTGWPALSAATEEPWVMAWPEGGLADPNALLDLAVAAESSRADAVGYGPGSSSQFVPDLPLRGSLVRRELLAGSTTSSGRVAGDERLDAWARRGSRLFATPASDGTAGR